MAERATSGPRPGVYTQGAVLGGEALYARYTAALAEVWQPTGGTIFAMVGRGNPEVPKAWPFLTAAERAAWDKLSETVLVRDG